MHMYPMDCSHNMIKQWINDAVEFNDWSIDIRFNVPDDLHSIQSEYTNQTDSAQDLLGEISQTILQDKRVNGSITFVDTTATIYITIV